MRSLMLLKLMIDLFFYGMILFFLIGIGFAMSFDSINIGGQTFDDLNPTIIVYMIFTIMRPVIFFLAIYHIKQLAGRFIKGEIFTDRTSRHLKMIGYGFILYSVVESIGEYLNSIVNSTGDTIMSGNFMGFNSAWFQFTLGLLFIFMDKVFQNANALKQENDLTI